VVFFFFVLLDRRFKIDKLIARVYFFESNYFELTCNLFWHYGFCFFTTKIQNQQIEARLHDLNSPTIRTKRKTFILNVRLLFGSSALIDSLFTTTLILNQSFGPGNIIIKYTFFGFVLSVRV